MNDLTTPEDSAQQLAQEDEVTVVAGTQAEMTAALVMLSVRMAHRMSRLDEELCDLEANLKIAVKNKLRQEPIKAALLRTRHRREYYEKLKLAFDNGFVPVPNMDIDLFAIRTTRKKPAANTVEGSPDYGGPRTLPQMTNSPPAGEGQTVDVRPITRDRNWSKNVRNNDGSITEKEMVTRSAVEFADEIPFPFTLAKPRILEATAHAIALKLFDEIGVLPAQHRRGRGDPMVIGRMVLKEGYNRRTCSFLIAWFVDTRAL